MGATETTQGSLEELLSRCSDAAQRREPPSRADAGTTQSFR